VPREGGDASRLTSGPGIETAPIFSPDGTKIAFQGEYDGNVDVYVIDAAGGQPKRLTWHPGADIPVAWSPDGAHILFRSSRNSYSRFSRLFTVPAAGGVEEEVPLPMAEQGSYSGDGRQLAYLPLAPAFEAWKRYRGGRTTPIWIANLADSHVEKIPRDNSNDFNPMWVGSKIYFLSDRNGPVTLFSYDTQSKKVAQLVENKGLDLKSASAGPGVIAYEQFGSIWLFDLKSGQSKPVSIRVNADLPAVRPTFEKAARYLKNPGLSPTGVRAVFEARGEIVTFPADKGDPRNLTNTPGVAERSPAWSPDGKRIAWFSDETGEYRLQIRGQDGMGAAETYDLGAKPAFYYRPVWSPDGQKILYTDSNLAISWLDLASKKVTPVDADTYDTPERSIDPVWSPDNQWILYTKILKNHLRALMLYSLATGKVTQVSDGMSDAGFAQWDANGKYAYFTASTNLGLSNAWLDMSSIGHNVTRSVYIVVLSKDDPSPLAPESDDEKAPVKNNDKSDEKADTKADAKKPVTVHIDLENIGQRILALPIPEQDYVAMERGKTGILFLLEHPGQGPLVTIHKFDLKTRKTDKLLDGVTQFVISGNGEKMLLKQGDNWIIAASDAAPKPGAGVLKTDALELRVDPPAEWRQMYKEVWRIERDFFYDPAYHGLNLHNASEKYSVYLDHLGSREDLNYLFREMLGELSVGHLFVNGGDMPDVKKVKGGLLGADYHIENGRYRFAAVYSGENWNPQLKAPLTQPGVNVVAGEYLLSVNGQEVRPPANVYSFFEATAGKAVLLRVGPDPGGANAREVTVIPVEDEIALRGLAWVEGNRRKVDQLSGGRLAYVYMPNTAQAGYNSFNRYYFAQIGREGAVIDERFNGGGDIADYVIDYLKRPLTNFFTTRAGEPFTTPQNAIFGPKAMIVNEYAGSGGDAMPWLFRDQKIGPLIGKRTWGGLVGIFGFPQLIDGGSVTAPNLAFYNLKASWDVENHGVTPDIDVEFDPAQWRAGHDPQLEKAVAVLMEQLKEHPLPTYRRPEPTKFPRADN
jgi:tricorn protease